METVVWIAQIILAAIFLGAGMGKLTQPRERLAEGQMPWAADFTDGQVKVIGALEVLATVGLILPAALDIVPVVTAFAASGGLLLMLAAMRTHLRRGERMMLPINVGVLALALFVAVEYFGSHSS